MGTVSRLRALNTFFKLTPKEKEEMGWFSKKLISKRWNIWCFEFKFEMKSSKGIMGRFGGGWNWKVGIQVGGKTIIIYLLVASLWISYKNKKEKNLNE